MKTIAALLLFLASIGLSQSTASTGGRCSPAITQTGGNVTITYQSNSCPELDASTAAQVKAFLRKFPKTVDRLNELLDKKDVELKERAKEVQDWIMKYSELEKQLAAQGDDSELSRRAAALLRDNDLNGAGKLLDEIISRGESRLDVLAQDFFNRGRVYELEFRTDQAVGQYQKAMQYRPENTQYAFDYAFALAVQNRHAEATVEYERLAAKFRKLAKDNPAAYLPNLALTLNNLGDLYRDT
jgi:tetratricopeptide (TPR) repeat protein